MADIPTGLDDAGPRRSRSRSPCSRVQLAVASRIYAQLVAGEQVPYSQILNAIHGIEKFPRNPDELNSLQLPGTETVGTENNAVVFQSAILGKLYLAVGEPELAVSLLRKYLADISVEGAQMSEEASWHLICALWQLSSYCDAIDACRQATIRYSKSPRFFETLGDLLAVQAREAEEVGTGRKGDKAVDLHEQSIAALRNALELGPTRISAWKSLVKQLSAAGLMDECRRTVQTAIDRDFKIWNRYLQYPDHFQPGLGSKPWYDATDFQFCSQLEQQYETIRLEFEEALKNIKEHPLVDHGELQLTNGTGHWREIVMVGPGSGKGRKLCPKTAKLLDQVPGLKTLARARAGCGNAIFSTLGAGSRLRAHCGPTNVRLTCHLGVNVPTDCGLRVGNEVREWKKGKCLVFDDSWEHEVWNNSDQPRTVLLFNFWHPDLPAGWHPDQLLCMSRYQ